MIDEATVSAGAIVLREVDGELKIALTHNPGRYSPDTWVLPKGHIELGESLEQATLREVREEIGLSNVQLIMYLGKIERPSEESWGEVVDKIIHIYLAYALGNEPFQYQTDKYVTEAGWFSFPQAIKHIPYEKDRDFLMEHLTPLFTDYVRSN